MFSFSSKIYSTLLAFTLVVSATFTHATDNALPLPKLIKGDADELVYLLPMSHQIEAWDDAEALSEPRVQFVWKAPKESGNQSIWSMNFDGTDMRQVVDAQLLDTPTKSYIDRRNALSRSPDNRYLAFMANTPKGHERRIIDLKTKEVMVWKDKSMYAMFNWLPDSKTILFDTIDGIIEYDVTTKTGKNIKPRFKIDGDLHFFTLIDNGTKVIASVRAKDDMREYNGYIFELESGKLLKEVPGWYVGNSHRNIFTYDKQFLISHNEGRVRGYAWSYTLTPDLPFEKTPSGSALTYGAPVAQAYTRGIAVYHKGAKKSLNYRMPNHEASNVGVGNLSIYNVRKTDLDKYHAKASQYKESIAQQLEDFTKRNKRPTDKELEEYAKAAREFNEWLMNWGNDTVEN